MAENTSNNVIVDEKVPATIMVEQRTSDSVANLAPIPQGISLKADGGCIRGGDSASDTLEKWMFLDSVEWKADSSSLFSYGLPGSVIDKNPNSPTAMMFRNHKYWNGDMEVKIQVNSSKFMIGRLVVSFYYGKDWDDKFADCRGNNFQRVQNMHTFVSAASNNVAHFKIPYSYPKPFIATRSSSKSEKALYLGDLDCNVLNKLKATSGTSKSCWISIWVRFENNNFSGLISSAVKKSVAVEHQILDTPIRIVNAFDKLVNGENSGNRDLPANPLSPAAMVPRTMNSMSVGKNDVSNITSLRLDAISSTPYVGKPASTKVLDICREWGLIGKFELKTAGNVSKKQIAYYPVSPLYDTDGFKKIKDSVQQNLPTYSVTPLACVSSLFSMWKGSIEFRFDFVASQYHTGRFLIAFVPDDNNKNLSIDDAKCSYNVVFDLEEDNSVIFTTPYIADCPWWPIRGSDLYNKEAYQYPGYIYLYVLNPLVVMDSIPNEIDINVFVRAGKDFELAVPAGPILGLGWDRDVLIVNKDKVMFAPGYGNIYVGTWRNYYGGQKCILRYGEVSDHVAQVVNGAYNTVYVLNTTFKNILNFSADVPIGSGKFQRQSGYFKYMVIPYIPGDTPRYVVPFFSYTDAANFVRQGNDFGYNFVGASGQHDFGAAIFSPTVSVEHQVRELNPGCSTANNFSKFCFGESFDDLKDLLRRYQLYMRDSLLIAPNMDTGLICFQFPVMPAGLPIRIHKGSDLIGTFNAFRQGHIPFILSAFRFFRGSIRLKIVFVCDMDIVTLIQFIPNVFVTSNSVFIPDRSKALSHYGLSYPTTIQASSVNKVVEFEVPFYMNTHLGLLQRPSIVSDASKYNDIHRYFSLGNVTVSFLNTFAANSKVEMNVYYAVGDDFEPYMYQGFPTVTHISDVPVFDRQEQQDSGNIVTIKKDELVKYDFKPPSFKIQEVGDYSEIVHQTKIDHQILVGAPLAYLTAKKIKDTTSDICGTAKLAFNVAQKAKAVHQTFNESTMDCIRKFIDTHFGDLSSSFKQLAFNSLSQLIHCFINPKPPTVAWALASFFVSVGFITLDTMSTVVSFFEKLLNYARTDSSDRDPEEINISDLGTAVAQHQNFSEDIISEKDKIAFLSVCISGIAASLGMVVSFPKKERTFMAYLNWMLRGFSSFVLTTKVILEILTKTMGIFTKIFEWLCGKKEPSFYWQKELRMHKSEMEEWANKVTAFTDPMYFERIEKSIHLQKEVFDLANVGNLYIAKAVNAVDSDPAFQIIRSLSTQINKVQSRLMEKHLAPAAKFEPFVFQLFGETNIGKSTLQYTIGADMLKKIGYTGYGEFIYTRTPGNKHLNTLSDQKIFVMDDFLQVRTGDIEQECISELFCLKSRGIYNPPMAELSDKKIRYSPLIVMLSANEAFWQVNSISDRRALYRRRDTLWYVESKQEYKGKKMSEIPKDVRDNFGHLFFVKVDPLDELFDPLAVKESEKLIYDDFKVVLMQEWYNYYILEMENYKRFLKVLYQLYPNDECLTVEDYKKLQEEQTQTVVKDYLQRDLQDAATFRKLNLEASLPLKPPQEIEHQTLEEETSLSEDADKLAKLINGDCTNSLADSKIEEKDRLAYETVKKQIVYSHDPNSLPVRSVTHVISDDKTRLNLLYKEKLTQALDNKNLLKDLINGNLGIFHPDFLCYVQDINIDTAFNTSSDYLVHSLYNNMKKSILEAGSHHNQFTYYMDIAPFDFDLLLKFILKYQEKYSEKPYFTDCKEASQYRKLGCYCSHFNSDFIYLAEQKGFGILGCFDNIIPLECKSVECFRKSHPIIKAMIEYKMSMLYIDASSVNGDALDKTVTRKEIFQDKPQYILEICSILLDKVIVVDTDEGKFSSKTVKMREHIKNVFSKIDSFTHFSDFINWCKTKFKNFFSASYVEQALGIFRICVIGKLFYKVVTTLFYCASPKETQGGAIEGGETRPESAYNSKPSGPGKPKARPIRREHKFRPYEEGVTHQTFNENQFKALVGALGTNVFVLTATAGTHRQTGRGLGLFGNVAIILKHHLEGISRCFETGQEVSLTIARGGSVLDVEYRDCDFRVDEASSLCFVKFPRRIPFFKKIIQYFPKADEMEFVPATGVIFDTDGKTLIQTNVYYTRYDDLTISSNEYASSQVLDITFRYNYGKQGLCGAPLICSGSNPRIIGIHVAGNGSTHGYSQPVYQEFVESSGFCQEFVKDYADHQSYNNAPPKFGYGANIIVRGSVDPCNRIHYPKRTRIVPSPLFGEYPATTTPAPLCSSDERLEPGRDLLYEALQKRNNIPKSFNASSVDFARRTVSEQILCNVRPLLADRSISVLEPQEALFGIPGVQEYTGIDFRTSEGYPWVLSRPRGAKNKSWLFNVDRTGPNPRLAGIHPGLLEVLESRHQDRINGRIPITIFTDSLKDARIDPSKISKPAPTRVFSMSPIDFTLSVKQLFGHFQAALINGRIHSGTAIGINPDGRDWGELFRYLTQVGDQCFEGDYKAFGDTLDPELVHSAVDIINEWYRLWYNEDPDSDPQRERLVIAKEISHAHYLARDAIYQGCAGLPSGCPITVEINSIVGLLYLAIGYFESVPPEFRTSRLYFQFIKPITYGDDFLLAVHSKIRSYFNGEFLRKFLGSHNITVTNSNKTSDPIEFRHICNSSFLKRSFAQHPTRPLERLAPIRENVCEESLLWQWNTAIDPVFQSMATCRSSLDLMYSRGPEIYEQFRKNIIAMWANRGYHFHSLTWYEIDARIYENEKKVFKNLFTEEFDEEPHTMRCNFYTGPWAEVKKLF